MNRKPVKPLSRICIILTENCKFVWLHWFFSYSNATIIWNVNALKFDLPYTVSNHDTYTFSIFIFRKSESKKFHRYMVVIKKKITGTIILRRQASILVCNFLFDIPRISNGNSRCDTITNKAIGVFAAFIRYIWHDVRLNWTGHDW